MRHTPRLLTLATALLAVAMPLTLTGCKDTDDTSSTAVTISSGGRSVTIPKEPRHIVSLSPTATEMLFAIGAGKQVAAVDDQSNYPKQAPRTKLSGLTPNVDSIAQYKPDLVVVSNDSNGVVKNLTKLRVPVLVEPVANDLTDTYHQLSDLGKATRHSGKAEAVAKGVRTKINAAVASAQHGTKKKLSYYYELDSTYYTATSRTFVGKLFAKFGLTNIADGADKDSVKDGYTQTSAESIIHANPDLVFLADTVSGQQSAKTVEQRPGWSELAAVKDHRVIELDDDVASRWGPRVVELVEKVSTAVRSAATGNA